MNSYLDITGFLHRQGYFYLSRVFYEIDTIIDLGYQTKKLLSNIIAIKVFTDIKKRTA